MSGEKKMTDLLIDLYKNDITLKITRHTEGFFFGVKIQLEQQVGLGLLPTKRMYRLVSLNDIQLVDEDEWDKNTIIIDLIKDMVKEMVESEEK